MRQPRPTHPVRDPYDPTRAAVMAGLAELDNLARRKAERVRAPRCARGNRRMNRERGNQVCLHDMARAALERALLRIEPSTRAWAPAVKKIAGHGGEERRHRRQRFPCSDVPGRRGFCRQAKRNLLKVVEITRQRQYAPVPAGIQPARTIRDCPECTCDLARSCAFAKSAECRGSRGHLSHDQLTARCLNPLAWTHHPSPGHAELRNHLRLARCRCG